MSRGSILIPIVVFAALGLIVSSIFVVPKFQNNKPAPDATDSSRSQAAPEENSDWKTYENIGFKLRFKYPPELSTKEIYDLGPGYMQINVLESSQKAQAIFMIKFFYEKEDAYDFVGSKPDDVKDINGTTWYYFEFPEGYSNSPPFTVFQDEKNGTFYSFKFYNSMSNKIRDEIVKTIEIIP